MAPGRSTLQLTQPIASFMRACLQQSADRLRQAEASNDTIGLPNAEQVHQSRVAIRRARATLSLCEDLLPRRRRRQLQRRLRWLSKKLGEVRDLDVYSAHLNDYLAAMPDDTRTRLATYESRLQERCVSARSALAPLYRRRRYQRLMASFAGLLQRLANEREWKRRWHATLAEELPARIERATRRLLRYGNGIRSGSPPEKLHRLRIRVKKLRYQLEYCAEVYPRTLQRASRAARRLQNHLGAYQDACIASRRLQKHARTINSQSGTDSELAPLRKLHRHQLARARSLRRQFNDEWARFAAAAQHLDWPETASHDTP